MKSQQIKISIILLYLFFTTASIFAQTAVEKINSANIGDNIYFDTYTWRVVQKVDKPDGHRYALLYGMTNFHYGKFGTTNVYNSSDIRAVFTNRYATNSEYNQLRQIAVLATLNNGPNFDEYARTVLPDYPKLASATGTTQDVIFLPSWRDVRDWGNVNLAATFPHTNGRLITRNYTTNPPYSANNLIGFITTDSKTLKDDAGIPATTPNSNGILHFRPCIWVRYGSLGPTIVDISPIGAVCAGENLALPTPTIIYNGYTITSQGWQIESSAGNFTNLSLPYSASYSDSGKKLRYYINYSGGSYFSNAITLTVNPVPELNQPANLNFCQDESVAPISFSGTNVNTVSWQIISGQGSDIGLSTNSGIGDIPGFYTTNITSSLVTITIEVTPVSNLGCNGAAKTFTISVKPKATSNNIISRDTTIYLGNAVNLDDLVTSNSVINPVFKWYLFPSPFDTEPIYPIVFPPVLGPHYYFVSVEGDNVCENDWDTRKPVTVTVIENIEEIEVCESTTVTFTAIPTNGGTLPTYQWKLNNENIPNATDFTFSYVPQHGDTISCEMISNANCASPSTVQSLRYVITLNPKPVLNQLNNLTSCHGDAFSHLSFAGTNNINRVEWEVTSGSGTNIGMNANSGTGDIQGFTAINTTNSPIIVEISATPYSDIDCKGEIMTFSIEVFPRPAAPVLKADADTIICNGFLITESFLRTLISFYENEPPLFFWDSGLTIPFMDIYANDLDESYTIYVVAVNPETACRTFAKDALKITLQVNCHTLRGTVFPFIYYNEPELDKLFPVVAELYDLNLIPKKQGENAILDAISTLNPLHTDTAVYYDGTEFIANTPKYPGYLGRIDNPGLPILWSELGHHSRSRNNTALLSGEKPKTPLGIIKFKDVKKGNYVLVLSKAGYVTRFATVIVNNEDILLGHRELILGDVNGDFIVNEYDQEMLTSNLSHHDRESVYNQKYDFDGSLQIDLIDILNIKVYMYFHPKLYEETKQFFLENK